MISKINTWVTSLPAVLGLLAANCWRQSIISQHFLALSVMVSPPALVLVTSLLPHSTCYPCLLFQAAAAAPAGVPVPGRGTQHWCSGQDWARRLRAHRSGPCRCGCHDGHLHQVLWLCWGLHCCKQVTKAEGGLHSACCCRHVLLAASSCSAVVYPAVGQVCFSMHTAAASPQDMFRLLTCLNFLLVLVLAKYVLLPTFQQLHTICQRNLPAVLHTALLHLSLLPCRPTVQRQHDKNPSKPMHTAPLHLVCAALQAHFPEAARRQLQQFVHRCATCMMSPVAAALQTCSMQLDMRPAPLHLV